MIKFFSFLLSPKIWFEPTPIPSAFGGATGQVFFSGLFGGFERCGSTAFPNFCGGNFPEKCVRTNSRILHQKGKVKEFWFGPPPPAPPFFFIFWGEKKIPIFFFWGGKNLIFNFF